MASKRRRMTAEQFSDSGLLYLVNSTILWPLGISLAYTANEDGAVRKRLDIVSVEPPQRIAMLDDPSHRRLMEAVQDTLSDRLASMPDIDREESLAILSEVAAVRSILTSDGE